MTVPIDRIDSIRASPPRMTHKGSRDTTGKKDVIPHRLDVHIAFRESTSESDTKSEAFG
jgi:hypothetical protein